MLDCPDQISGVAPRARQSADPPAPGKPMPHEARLPVPGHATWRLQRHRSPRYRSSRTVSVQVVDRPAGNSRNNLSIKLLSGRWRIFEFHEKTQKRLPVDETPVRARDARPSLVEIIDSTLRSGYFGEGGQVAS